MVIRIAPSILAADFAALGDVCVGMQEAGADLLHVDVMDGHFVPNLSIGPAVVRCLRPRVRLPLDVHLMLEEPMRFAPVFMEAGADWITFHAEAVPDIRGALREIKALGVRAGVVLKPATPAQAVFSALEEADVVMVMTVEPGFGGQAFIPEMPAKIAALRAEALRRGLAPDIEVDGGIDCRTAWECARAGANVFVAGSSLFGAADCGRAVAALRAAASRGWAGEDIDGVAVEQQP